MENVTFRQVKKPGGDIAFEGESIAKMYPGNWSDYATMMMEKFGKDLQPHRVKYRTLKR